MLFYAVLNERLDQKNHNLIEMLQKSDKNVDVP